MHDTRQPIHSNPWMPSLEKTQLLKVLGERNEELLRLNQRVAALDEELKGFRAARDAKLLREKAEATARISGGFQE